MLKGVRHKYLSYSDEMEKMETVVPIGDHEEVTSVSLKTVKTKPTVLVSCCLPIVHKLAVHDRKKLLHSIKVGLALVLVSLLYLIQPLYEQVGDNAMWAIMTVVVVFEYSAGATLSKGLNRGMGTIAGGGLGCLAALLAREVGQITSAVAIGIFVFMAGAAATYTRLIPSFKRKYDYGAMIFILTFSLIAVSGFRSEEIIQLACDRLLTIVIGFAVCIMISLFFFPVWAGDELHRSLANKFDNLAKAIEESLEDYFNSDNETRASANFSACTSVLYSKATDETLTNFARWEPWHGKFCFSYPWDKYLKTGELLRELAASIFTLKGCLHSHKQMSQLPLRMAIKEPCLALGNLLSSTLWELRYSILNMQTCRLKETTTAKLNSTTAELRLAISSSLTSKMADENEIIGNGFVMSVVFTLLDLGDKVERLVKEVEDLGHLAEF